MYCWSLKQVRESEKHILTQHETPWLQNSNWLGSEMWEIFTIQKSVAKIKENSTKILANNIKMSLWTFYVCYTVNNKHDNTLRAVLKNKIFKKRRMKVLLHAHYVKLGSCLVWDNNTDELYQKCSLQKFLYILEHP